MAEQREDANRKATSADLPLLRCADKAEWTDWLGRHHDSSAGVWLVIAKGDARDSSLTYLEAVEAALCYGWIDGQKRSHTSSSWLQRFTRRGKRSIWSKINREKAEALIESRAMKPPGLAEVERAQQDGRWEAAYESQSRAAVPDDFQAALDRSPKAKDFWSALDSGNRYAMLFRIHTVKRAETRAKKIEQFVAMLERHEKIHP
jgi:uncharacterized protein YdeI (YjbR/CyaY-like superfamily)